MVLFLLGYRFAEEASTGSINVASFAGPVLEKIFMNPWQTSMVAMNNDAYTGFTFVAVLGYMAYVYWISLLQALVIGEVAVSNLK